MTAASSAERISLTRWLFLRMLALYTSAVGHEPTARALGLPIGGPGVSAAAGRLAAKQS